MDLLVVCRRMVFGVVVTQILKSGMPFYVELFVGNLVCDPEILHFHRMGSLAFNRVIGNSSSGGVVAVDWCWRLRVS